MTKIKYSIIICLSISISLIGQVSHTLYFMDRIPQSNQLNPAIQPKCNFYFGIPVLSSFYFDLGNSSLSVNKILQYNSVLDSVITFLHPKADRSIFFDALKDQNNFFNTIQSDILSFGFRTGNLYFTFNSAIKSNLYFTYPKDLADLVINGSTVGDIHDFKTLGANLNLYAEFALGVSDRLSDELTVGGKVKLLSGIANVTTRNKSFQIETFEDSESKFVNQVTSDASILVYAPYFEETANGDNIPIDSIFQLKDDPLKALKPFESKGFGIDLGVMYSGIENLYLSAGILDLGYISWSKNTYEYKMRSSYTLSGKEINRDSLENAFSDIFGSIKDSITFSKSSKKYTTALPTKIYLGAEYFLETYFSFGLVSVSQFYLNQFYQQFTFSGNFRPMRATMLSVSYSFLNNGLSNFGLGLAYRPFPGLQFHFITDNIPLKYGKNYIPIAARSFNFRIGLNFVVGFSEKRKLKDKPLSWE